MRTSTSIQQSLSHKLPSVALLDFIFYIIFICLYWCTKVTSSKFIRRWASWWPISSDPKRGKSARPFNCLGRWRLVKVRGVWPWHWEQVHPRSSGSIWINLDQSLFITDVHHMFHTNWWLDVAVAGWPSQLRFNCLLLMIIHGCLHCLLHVRRVCFIRWRSSRMPP